MGVWNLLEDKNPAEKLVVAGVEVKAGDRVRLHPGKRADIFDMALAGEDRAVIESMTNRTMRGKFHLCVVADDESRKGYRNDAATRPSLFLFPEEVEPLGTDEGSANVAAHWRPPFLSLELEIFFWATTHSAWKWLAACQPARCPRAYI